MPCWYFEKKDLVHSPSLKDGITPAIECNYRREGARFIMDAGTRMGLRYDTCATGVIYFHRFYLFHSFKEFHRHVMAACCLFLAGKVEETPKKCKDLIKITRGMLTEEQFAVFGQDPKEEVMTLERILLQTIKFDLMVEHPYAYVLKFAKLIKGDKAKIQKMVQMSWTFVNDSLCTTLCLQWEAEVIAVAMMYLTSRLSKFEPNDWHGKPSGFRGKWYEFLVNDVTVELLEDICHQVLDLYSKPSNKSSESPATSSSLNELVKSTNKSTKSPKKSTHDDSSYSAEMSAADTNPDSSTSQQPARPTAAAVGSYSHTNPYIATPMYTSSFMSGEGSESLKSMMTSSAERRGSNPPTPHKIDEHPHYTSQHHLAYSGAAAAIPFQQQQQIPAAAAYQSQQLPAAAAYQSQQLPIAAAYQSQQLPAAAAYQFQQGSTAAAYQSQQIPQAPVYRQAPAAEGYQQIPAAHHSAAAAHQHQHQAAEGHHFYFKS